MTSPCRKVLAIFGPTGVGKTRLGISVAKYLGGEVISVDSLQCYKNGSIMSAQPTPEEKSQVPHHLVAYLDDHEEPHDNYVDLAMRTVADIRSRRRIPVFVGGSMSLTLPLLNKLISQNNDIMVITLRPDLQGASYVDALEHRIDEMVSNGLLEQVHTLHSSRKASMKGERLVGVWKCIGYPELIPYDECPEDDPFRSLLRDAGLAEVKVNTLKYAKAQLNWVKQDLIPMVRSHGMQYLNLAVDVDGKNWSADVEKPAVCAGSNFIASELVQSPQPHQPIETQQRVICVL